MKINEVKRLAAAHNEAELLAAAAALENGSPTGFDVDGKDDGERLTHLLGAVEVIRCMHADHCDLMTSLRAFAKRVRAVITD